MVKRYMNGRDGYYEHPHGGVCFSEDIEKLKQENEALKDELEVLRALIQINKQRGEISDCQFCKHLDNVCTYFKGCKWEWNGKKLEGGD